MTDKTDLCDSCGSNVMPLEPGVLLADRFRLIRVLGRGGIGHVWLAEDIRMDNDRVACKIIRAKPLSNRCLDTDLKREVLLARRLRHPNILGVYTFFQTETYCFITMEYVDGQSLADALIANGQPFSPHQVLPWVIQLCNALDYAHNQQILHRDIKPANILLGTDQILRLADFGIAQLVQELRTQETGRMTQGTLLFMSPEQLAGNEMDARSDIYSLAATIYTLLNGTPPFHRGSIITQIQLKPAPPISGIDAAINQVLLRSLSKDPQQRPSSCAAFAREFIAAIQDMSETSASAHPLSAAIQSDAETIRLPGRIPKQRMTRLGDMLIAAGVILADELQTALEQQARTGDKLGSILIASGYADEQRIVEVVAEQLQIPHVQLEAIVPEPALLQIIPESMARSLHCLPLRKDGERVLAAMTDPLDLAVLNQFELAFAATVDPAIATESDLLAAISRAYQQ